jgi:hypothetical protein
MRILDLKRFLAAVFAVSMVTAAESPTLTQPVVAEMRITEQRRPVGSSSWTTISERTAVQARSSDGDTVQDGILGPRSVRVFNATKKQRYVWFHGSSEVSASAALSPSELREQGPSIQQIAQKAIRTDSVSGFPCHVFAVKMGSPRGGAPSTVGETCHSLEYDLILRHEFTQIVGDEEVRHVAEATSLQVGVEPDASLFLPPGQ